VAAAAWSGQGSAGSDADCGRLGCSLQAGGTAVVECRVLVSCCAPGPPAVGGGSACPVFILGWVAFAWAFWSNCPFFVISQSITVVHLLKKPFFSTELEGSKPLQKFIKTTKSYRETKQQNSKAKKVFSQRIEGEKIRTWEQTAFVSTNPKNLEIWLLPSNKPVSTLY
jgi:hypothetical protein